MKVSFIGFGVAGYGLGKGLKTGGVEEVYFYDAHWNLPPFDVVIRKRASEARATRDKLNWCSSLGLREQLGGEIPESVDQALESMLRSASELKS